MTRATRSQTVHQPPKPADTPSQNQLLKKSKDLKKRKRGTLPDDEHEDARARKLPRRAPSPRGEQDQEPALDPEQAQAVLDVLEEIDSQGLLDRVFSPEPSDQQAYSLRSLLQGAGGLHIKQLQAAVEPLLPISSYPRSRLTETAQQQLDFCLLASRLLDQAAQLSTSHILSSKPIPLLDSQEGIDGDPLPNQLPRPHRRHALMQKLNNGDYWTSLSSASDGARSSLPSTVACAQVVAVLPSLPHPAIARSTLATLEVSPKANHKFKHLHLHPRQLSRGNFLDYGAYAAFAPTWDSEGAEVGRDCVGACFEHKRLRQIQVRSSTAKRVPSPESVVPEDLDGKSHSGPEDMSNEDFDVSQVLETLQVETGAEQLLNANAHAIERLRYLQNLRILRGESVVREQLEHSTAASLESSLGALLSLRPRKLSADINGKSFLLPTPRALRGAKSMLPGLHSDGWQGTLAEGRVRALRDDNTIIPRPGTTASKQSASNTTTTSLSTPYRSGYSYYPPSVANQATYYPSHYSAAYGATTTPQTPYPYSTAWSYGYPSSTGQKPAAPGTATGYPSYYPMASPATQRVVANTTKPLGQQQVNGWSSSALPIHMRKAGPPAVSTPLKQVQNAPPTTV